MLLKILLKYSFNNYTLIEPRINANPIMPTVSSGEGRTNNITSNVPHVGRLWALTELMYLWRQHLTVIIINKKY